MCVFNYSFISNSWYDARHAYANAEDPSLVKKSKPNQHLTFCDEKTSSTTNSVVLRYTS